MRKRTEYMMLGVLFFLLICVIVHFFAGVNRITVLEWSDEELDIPKEDFAGDIRLHFTSPYDLLTGMTLLPTIPVFDHMDYEILEAETGKVVEYCQRSTLQKERNKFYSLGKVIKVNKGEDYVIRIIPKEGFSRDVIPSGFRIYGGNKDTWWDWYYSLLIAVGALLIFLICRELRKDNNIWNNRFLLSAIAGYGFLIACLIFCTSVRFEDEIDNIYGGILIADGGELYRDYITQHMPFGYYICAVFSFLGANSVEQYECLFYILQAVAFVYFCWRYYPKYGKKLLLFPALEIVLVNNVNIIRGMVLGENIVEMAMLFLAMEMMDYLADHSLKADRAVLVSVCVYLSVFSVFISVYPLSFIAVFFLICEVILWKKRELGNPGIGSFVKRYCLFLTLMVCIPAAVLGCFALHHNFEAFYQNAYLFNREVYPVYNGGMGYNPLFPVFDSGVNFIHTLVPDWTGKGTDFHSPAYTIPANLIMWLGVVFSVFGLKRIHIPELVVLWGLILLNALRLDWVWHNTPSFGIVILLIILRGKNILGKIHWHKTLLLITVSVYFVSVFVIRLLPLSMETDLMVRMNNETDHQVILETSAGDEVFLDGLYCDPIYIRSMGRKPINRLLWFHPWYMDWYGEEMEQLINTRKPVALIWDPDQEIWGFSGYMEDLRETVQKGYEESKEAEHYWRRKDDQSV